MLLDNSTLLIVGATICGSAAGLQALVALRLGFRALWWWSAANVVLVFACAMPALGTIVHPVLFALLTTAPLAFASSCIVAGLRVLDGRRFSRIEAVAGPLLVVACVGLTYVIGDNYGLRVLIVAFGLDYYLLRSAQLLWHLRQYHFRGVRSVCALVAIVVAVFYTSRCLMVYLDGVKVLDLAHDAGGSASRAIGLVAISIWNVISVLLPVDRLTSLDDLTGLLNRRTLFTRGVSEVQLAIAQKRRLSVLMIDLDHFKQINDRFGHQIGDVVLRTFGRVVTQSLAQGGLVGRVGGEEFCIILPDADADRAFDVAERLRASCEQQLRLSLDASAMVTVSVGTATYEAGLTCLSTLMKIADKALYEAKAAGRNVVVGRRLAA